MKRPIARGRTSALILAAALLAAGCGDRAAPTTPEAPPQNGWVMSPVIDQVAQAGANLTITGHAAPLGRVVVSGPGGAAYAAGADVEGRFDLRVPRPSADTLFLVEARVGQVAYPAPYRLLVAADPAGPIGLLSVGAATVRLDPGSALDAVDSDGTAALLSGRAAPETTVAVDLDGPRTVTTDAEGRWTLAIPGSGVAPVRVGAVAYAPTPGSGAADGVLERAGAGWRISWSIPSGARQTTWFPDRR